jgi:L-ribulose-5-phosphate 3-epimerase
MNRRQFTTLTALAIAGRSFAEARAAGFKIGACEWTLGTTANPATLELAKRIGLDGMQPDFGRPGEDGKSLPLFDTALQDRCLADAKRLGLELPSLAMGVLNSIPYKSDPRAEEWVMNSLDVCKRMGIRTVLLAFFGNGDLRNDAKGTDAVIARLKALAPLAEKAGIVYGIESWLKVDALEPILKAVNSPAIQCYYDVGNMHKEGADICAEIRTLGKARICEIHAKDYDNIYGKGSVNFPKVREAFDTIGYRGWLHMEGTQMPHGIEKTCRMDLEYLRGVFPMRG